MVREFGRNRGSVVVAKPWPKPRLLSSVVLKTQEDSMSVAAVEAGEDFLPERLADALDAGKVVLLPWAS